MTTASSSTPSGGMAQATFELNNSIVPLDASTLDSIFAYDTEAQRAILRAQPWKSDPHFFTKVRISAVALIKMVMHARSGGIYEIMGLMQGKIDVENRTLYVMDSFALPVEGTETRVNAQNEAYEYMVQYLDDSKQVGRLENVVGWYHSHPGYGCWLSGIDVGTQRTNQQFQDPFVAIVIDPNRTISTGKVDIGAFRTYPEGYVAEEDKQGGVQSVPLDKIEDFGVHAGHYYPLEVEHFKSSLDAKLVDLLWNKYWQNTLAQSPLVTNRAYTTDQIRDLAGKLAQSHPAITNRSSAASNPFPPPPKAETDNKQESATAEKLVEQMSNKAQSSTLANPAHDARKLAAEANHALLTSSLKSALFLPQ